MGQFLEVSWEYVKSVLLGKWTALLGGTVFLWELLSRWQPSRFPAIPNTWYWRIAVLYLLVAPFLSSRELWLMIERSRQRIGVSLLGCGSADGDYTLALTTESAIFPIRLKVRFAEGVSLTDLRCGLVRRQLIDKHGLSLAGLVRGDTRYVIRGRARSRRKELLVSIDNATFNPNQVIAVAFKCGSTPVVDWAVQHSGRLK